MKKIISLLSVLVLTCSLIGCTAEKQSEDKYNGFKLNVDVDEFVSRQEKELQDYSKINDLSIKVNDEKKSIVINVPVDLSENTDYIRKTIINDQTKLDLINNLFNKALNTFDFCNPIANYKIDLNIINKSNEESVFEIISDKEITTNDIQKILKKDMKDTDNSNDNNNSESNPNIQNSNPNVQSNSDLQSGYDLGLINTLKIQTESINSYLGEPQININHESYIVKIIYNNAPTELLTLIEQGRWTDEDYVNAYSYLDDNVKEIVGQEYDTVLTIKCNGQVLYAN